MTTREDLTAASLSTCRAPSGWQDFVRRDGIPPFPFAPADQARVVPAQRSPPGPVLGHFGTTWIEVERADGIYHYHGDVTVDGHAVHIETVGASLRNPGRSLIYCFIYVDGQLAGHGTKGGSSIGLGWTPPARAMVGELILTVPGWMRGAVVLHRSETLGESGL